MNFSARMKLCIFILLLIVSGTDVKKICCSLFTTIYLIIRIDRIFVCKCASDCVITDFETTLIHRRRESTVVNAQFTFLRDIENIKMRAGVERCRNSESLDTCENFGNLKISNACDYLKERNSLIGKLIYSISPPYKCPFKKGHYVAKNGTLDVNVFNLFPIDGWYWKFGSDYYNSSNDKLLWSFCFHGFVFDLH